MKTRALKNFGHSSETVTFLRVKKLGWAFGAS